MSERFCAELEIGWTTFRGYGINEAEALDSLALLVREELRERAMVYPVPDISVPFAAPVSSDATRE